MICLGETVHLSKFTPSVSQQNRLSSPRQTHQRVMNGMMQYYTIQGDSNATHTKQIDTQRRKAKNKKSHKLEPHRPSRPATNSKLSRTVEHIYKLAELYKCRTITERGLIDSPPITKVGDLNNERKSSRNTKRRTIHNAQKRRQKQILQTTATHLRTRL